MTAIKRREGEGAPRGRRSHATAVVGLLASVAASALLGGLAGPASAATRARPNVIVVETDDQAAETLRAMPNVKSEILDQGTTFTNSFVNFSQCCPSRATFLTGQYAHNHHVLSNHPPSGGFQRFAELYGHNNLATWLRKAGYRTALVGKYLNHFGANGKADVPRGWSRWVSAIGTEGGAQRVYNYDLEIDGRLVHFGHKPQDFKQDVLTHKAAGFLRDAAPSAKPFFLWLTYTAPHNAGPNPNPQPPSDCGGSPKPAPRHAHVFDSEPLPMPPSFNEEDVSDKPVQVQKLPRLGEQRIAHETKRYRCELESLQSVDEGVDAVLDQLRRSGELDRTFVIFTSDNGVMRGEHRITGGKGNPYEESIRVPLAIRGPGIPAGGTSSQLAINADLAPTIVRIAHARPRLVMDGRSLMPFARDPDRRVSRALLIEAAHFRGGQFAATFKGIRTKRYLYVRYRVGQRELYDLKADPFELENAHGQRRYRRAEHRLSRVLRKVRDCSGRRCRVRPRV
jgi:N-acetylglucosamine-6-sulfatase